MVRLQWLLVLVLLLAACGPAATPTLVPTAVPTPTRPPPATATPTTSGPKATPAATATPVPVATATPPKVAASGPRYGGTFRFAGSATGGGPLPPWDTIASGAGKAHQAIGGFVYGRLVRHNNGPEFGPPKCTKGFVNDALDNWRWVDDRSFEIKIKQGIRWHNKPPVNGRELVADDIAYNLAVISKKPGWGLMSLGQAVDKAEAVDKYTARIHLNQTYAIFPEELALGSRTYLYAKESVGGDKPQITSGEQVIGFGPFMHESTIANVSVTLKRNPTYHEKDLPYLGEIKAMLMADASTRAAAFRAGKVDMLEREGAIIAQQLAKQVPGAQYQSCAEIPTWPITFNHSKPPFNDVRVRRAVLMAVDQQVLVDLVYGGEATVTWTPLIAAWDPMYLKKEDYPPDVRQYLERNVQKAKQLLAEAGYANGFETILHWRPVGTRVPELAETVSGMLNEIGIKGTLRQVDVNQFNVHRYAGDLDGMMLAVGTYGLFTTPRFYHREIAGNEYNIQWYRNDTFAELLGKVALTIMTDQQKAEVARELQIHFIRDAINLPTPNIHQIMLFQPWVKGMYWTGTQAMDNWDWSYKGWLEQ